MTDGDVCERVLERASLYLDGYLPAGQRARMDRHLETCPSCRRELDTLRELSRRVGALAPDPLSADFAARVRRAALGERLVEETPFPLRGRTGPAHVAAAALVLLALAAAYLLGRRHGEQEAGPDPVLLGPEGAGSVPLRVQRDEVAALRAARSVVSDLSVIDHVPGRIRRPLLQAQLQHFRLANWAARASSHREQLREPVSEVAALIRRLDGVLKDDGPSDALLTLRNEARRPSMWVHVGPAAGARAPEESAQARRRAVLAAVASDLPAEVQRTLDLLLSLKESVVLGRHWHAVSLTRSRGGYSDALRPVIHVTLAASLGEAGLDELAVPFLLPLRQECPEVFSLLSETVFRGRDPLTAVRLGGSTRPHDLRSRLEALLLSGNRSGEVVVEEESTPNGYSYCVTIRKTPR